MVQFVVRIVAYPLNALAKAYPFYDARNGFAGMGTVHHVNGYIFLFVRGYEFSNALESIFDRVADHLVALSA